MLAWYRRHRELFHSDLPQRVARLEHIAVEQENEMAKIDDELKTLKDSEDAIKNDLTLIAQGITGLQATITDLKNQLAGSGLTADQQAALDAAVQEATDLKAQADAAAGLLPQA